MPLTSLGHRNYLSSLCSMSPLPPTPRCTGPRIPSGVTDYGRPSSTRGSGGARPSCVSSLPLTPVRVLLPRCPPAPGSSTEKKRSPSDHTARSAPGDRSSRTSQGSMSQTPVTCTVPQSYPVPSSTSPVPPHPCSFRHLPTLKPPTSPRPELHSSTQPQCHLNPTFVPSTSPVHVVPSPDITSTSVPLV